MLRAAMDEVYARIPAHSMVTFHDMQTVSANTGLMATAVMIVVPQFTLIHPYLHLLIVAPLLVFAVALLVLLFVVGTEASKSSSWSSFWTRKNTDDDFDDAKGFASIFKIEEEESFWKQAKNTTPEVLLRSELSCDACVATSVQIFGQIRHRVEAHERAKTSLGEEECTAEAVAIEAVVW